MSLDLPPDIVAGLVARTHPDGYRTTAEVLVACLEAIEEREGRVDVRLSRIHDEIVDGEGPAPRASDLSLPPAFERILAEKTRVRGYESPERLIEDGLHQLDREAAEWEIIRPAVQKAIGELDRGEGLSQEEVRARIRAMRKGVRI